MKFFIFCQGDILLTKEGTVPFGDSAPIELKPWERVTTLSTPFQLPRGGETAAEASHRGNCPLVAEQLGSVSDGGPKGLVGVVVASLSKPVTDNPDVQMVPLRKSFHILSPEDYQLAGKCAELVYFHQNSKFCGVCGGEMRWQTEISKQCKECGKELWPSLATAIIVRVTRGDEILMVHAHTFRDRHYGLVAGFVETGETLEECVQREVWEETHLRVTNIRYFASQPWPYPSGLMVGFTADYLSGELQLQKAELSDGGWYKKDNLPYLPDPSSIAYRLIMDWAK
jgi:NAD+ diphosphatase